MDSNLLKAGMFAVVWRRGLLQDDLFPEPREISEIREFYVVFSEKFPKMMHISKIIAVFNDCKMAQKAIEEATMTWKIQSAIVDHHEDLLRKATEQRKSMVIGVIEYQSTAEGGK